MGCEFQIFSYSWCMSKHRWGRSQKYHSRPRHLYALLFSDGIYIGQTVDLIQREAQHRSRKGGWGGKPFRVQPLGVIEGTEAEAVEYEHAWRLKAWKQGYRVFAKPPGIPCNPSRRATWHRRRLARRLKWPGQRQGLPGWKAAGWLAAVASVLLVMRMLTG